FVDKLDFLTTAGYLTGPGAREAAGLPPNTGPFRVITDLAVLGFHEKTRRMHVLSLHPGKSKEDVLAATGFELSFADRLGTTTMPTKEELHILDHEVDPHRYILGR